MTRKLALLVLAAFGALALACAPASTPATRVASAAPRYFGAVAPPRDNILRFTLGTEPELYDPGLAVGQPDGRVCRALLEGLTREDAQTLEPRPGQAYRWEISRDGLTYTFHLRPGLRWSDGHPVTAGDFLYSWRRVLDPATAARYSSMLYPVKNAERFNLGALKDADSLGLAAPDDSTFVVTLRAPTAYFLYVTQFYTALPVPRWVVEKYGRRWTRPENIVVNGAFRLKDWRQNDHFEFVKNWTYWDAEHVRLAGAIAYTIEELNTNVNLYKAGQLDWCPSGYVPAAFIPYLRGFADFVHGPYQGVQFFSMNVRRPPLDNVWVRRALNLAVDRDAIANDLLKRSRDPWGNIVPSGYPGYQRPAGIPFDPARARECLAKAGFPGGRGFPKIQILFNTSEDGRRLAEAVQAMWKRELGIDVELSNQEWGSYLQATIAGKYDIARRSWIGDYLDPNTFLSCWITGDGNNRTGWSSPRYDALLARAADDLDPARRLATLAAAESLELADGPIIPIYHFSTNELVKPYVHGIYRTPLDVHPLTYVWMDHDWPPTTTALATPAAGRR